MSHRARRNPIYVGEKIEKKEGFGTSARPRDDIEKEFGNQEWQKEKWKINAPTTTRCTTELPMLLTFPINLFALPFSHFYVFLAYLAFHCFFHARIPGELSSRNIVSFPFLPPPISPSFCLSLDHLSLFRRLSSRFLYFYWPPCLASREVAALELTRDSST